MTAKKTKGAKGDVASWLQSIGWSLSHEDPGSEGEAGVGYREASYSARNNKTLHDITMPSLQRLLDAVNEYEKIVRA